MTETPKDIEWILSVLPHRYPILLVDRVLELEPQKRIVAIKNVTVNEPIFQGHFPGRPVFPGVLLIEGMAQAGVAQVAQPGALPLALAGLAGGGHHAHVGGQGFGVPEISRVAQLRHQTRSRQRANALDAREQRAHLVLAQLALDVVVQGAQPLA